jgi:archaemetzincin
LPGRLRGLLQPGRDFRPLPPPRRGDWLDTYEEPGQSFEEFRRSAAARTTDCRRIYLLPLEGPEVVPDDCLSRFVRFTEAFFMLDVSLLPPCRIDDAPLEVRSDPEWGLYQWCAADILHELVTRRPEDALCLLAITASDLYPHALMNYTFGLAAVDQRVGVCSVARFGPPYCRESHHGNGRLACRGCRLLAHELGHLLGLQHCVYYACLMNGSTTLAEGDARPLHLCPIDLHKLQWLTGFDLEERYRRLSRLWRELGADEEAAWVERRLAACRIPASHG